MTVARPPCRLAALGVVNALGADTETVWRGLVAGEPSRLSWRDELIPGRRLLVGAVSDPLPQVPATLAPYACRNNAMALAALAQIEAPVRAVLASRGAARVGVVMGTSTSGVADAEDAFRYQRDHGGLDPSFDYAQLEFGGLGSFVAEWLGTSGPAYTLSTACSSGARALASARSLLAIGLCDAVVAGAADTLCGLTSNGFGALQAICEGVTNPCSKNRSGLTLGEGAAMFLLAARARAASSSRASGSRARRTTCRRPSRAARRRGGDARRARGRAPRARRDRLPEPPRHRHSAERRRWSVRRSSACSGSRAARELDEAARRPHAGRRRCASRRPSAG